MSSMCNWARLVLALLAALAAVSRADAGAGQDVELDVRVLAVRGNVVDVDRGSSARVEVGDVAVLRPLGRPEVLGTVRSVTSDAATVVLSAAVEGIAPGVPGTLRLPAERFEDLGPEVPEGMPVPVWTNPDDRWADDMPLLAEVRSPLPEERPTEWSGRGTLGGHFIDDGGALPRDEHTGFLGLDLEGRNPFGRGGRFHAGLELRGERTSFDELTLMDESETFVRIDRLSYEWGGTREAPDRFEVGRFTSREFPELGLLDGVEASHRFDNGVRIGGSLGMQPALDRERSFENSPRVSLWSIVPFASDDRGELGFALQETWFDGKPDRDLFLSRVRWTDGDAWRADATAWVDLYRSDDPEGKDDLELTELRAGLTRSFESGAGARIDAARVRFPALRRFSSQTLLEERLRAAESTTLSLSGWTPSGARGTWTGRLGGWQDEDENGAWVDAGYTRRVDGAFFDRWSLAAFWSDDEDAGVLGARAECSGRALGGRWTLGVDAGRFDVPSGGGADRDQTETALRAGWNGRVAADWYLYLDGVLRFGTEQDATSLAFTLQRSF